MALTAVEKLNKTRAKIAELQALLPSLELAAENDVNPEDIAVGTTIDYNFGRKEKVIKTGVVLAVRPGTGEKGSSTLIKVQSGEGFDTEVNTVFPAQVTKVYKAEVSSAQVEDIAALDAQVNAE